MRKPITLLFFCLALLCGSGRLHAQLAVGEWQAHMAYGNTSMNVWFGGRVFAVSEGSLFAYDPEDESIETFDIVQPMSDVCITRIAVCSDEKKLLLVYDNGNIDLMDTAGEVYNMTDLKNSSLTDKTVNDLCIEGSMAYLATNSGVVAVNIKKREIAATYLTGRQANSCAVMEGALFVALPDDGLYKGILTENLQDANKWTRLSENTFSRLLHFKGGLYALIPNNAFWSVDAKSGAASKLLDGKFSYLATVNGQMAVAGNGKFYLFDSAKDYQSVSTTSDITGISYGNSIYWVSASNENLSGYKLEEAALKPCVSPINLNAPKSNLFYRMFLQNGKLYACGGGLFLAPYNNPGVIQIADESGIWITYDGTEAMVATENKFKDITCLAIDPQDENHLFAASGSYGLFEFQDGKFVARYTTENSSVGCIHSWPSRAYVDGLKYDDEGNLWILSSIADDVIAVYTKDKKWINISHEQISRKYTMRETFFDRRGWMWCCSPNWSGPGIFILNHNNTLENTSDDQVVWIGEFLNQDGDRLENSLIYCMVEDKEGSLWIGTSNGTWLVSNPEQLLTNQSETATITQVKIPRNDGTNLADYLLAGTTILSMAIDGANRKWVGTEKDGIFLLSADGLEEIHHFTTENSPLPSDEIQCIAVDEQSGLVYIGTAKGLVTYQSDATEAQTSFSESNVRAYPNPVRPDYEGYISITGLMMNSQVKITDSYGSLIHEGTSIGGSFSWNGRNSKGRRVASGVYHVMATDENGSEGIVTKIVVVR